MRRVLFLDSTKKYQIWFSFAAISHPDEDRIVNFIIATRNGHAWRELVNVPKGSPFVYRQETTIMQAAQDEWVVPFMRINAASTSRQVAVGDIYIAEYTPSCFKPTEKTDLCGAVQGSYGATAYRTTIFDQGNEEICAQMCLRDENCVTFGWRVEQYSKSCNLFKDTKDKLRITANNYGRGAVFYNRSCWQCTGLDCWPS